MEGNIWYKCIKTAQWNSEIPEFTESNLYFFQDLRDKLKTTNDLWEAHYFRDAPDFDFSEYFTKATEEEITKYLS